MNRWLKAFRLRTLPVALAPALMGVGLGLLADELHKFSAALTVTTIILLQVLSNLANDYGDFESGVDDETRIGPERAMQAGLISKAEMKLAIFLFVLLSALSGLFLLYSSWGRIDQVSILFLGVFGVLAILAAIFYTMGSFPYGYFALGDLAVFIFFGLIGVLGTLLLQAGKITMISWAPAASLGLLITAVLNVNNMRDEVSDRLKKKNTLVVKIGGELAKKYHLGLHIVSFALMLFYAIISGRSWLLLPILLILFYLPLLRSVYNQSDSQQLDPYLKKHAIGSFLFSLFFLIGALIETQ
jgi:1,4-dihydroxy-2-naphthoate polyprenyltransferase